MAGQLLTGLGGSVMFISAVLFLVIAVADVVHGPRRSWALLDDIKVWVLVAVVLSMIIYGEVTLHYLPLNSVSPGFKLW